MYWEKQSSAAMLAGETAFGRSWDSADIALTIMMLHIYSSK